MSYPTYHIRTVSDFLQFPEERMEACLADFAQCLHTVRHTINIIRAMTEEMGAEVPEDAMAFPMFTWIDDGERVTRVQFVDGEEYTKGEVSSHPIH